MFSYSFTAFDEPLAAELVALVEDEQRDALRARVQGLEPPHVDAARVRRLERLRLIKNVPAHVLAAEEAWTDPLRAVVGALAGKGDASALDAPFVAWLAARDGVSLTGYPDEGDVDWVEALYWLLDPAHRKVSQLAGLEPWDLDRPTTPARLALFGTRSPPRLGEEPWFDGVPGQVGARGWHAVEDLPDVVALLEGLAGAAPPPAAEYEQVASYLWHDEEPGPYEAFLTHAERGRRELVDFYRRCLANQWSVGIAGP